MEVRKADRKLMATNHQKHTAEEAARQARNAYYREWRANNKDKVKQYNANYWVRKASQDAI